MTHELIDRIKTGTTPTAQYIGKYARLRRIQLPVDELAAAAWLDPTH